jgi:hypothetical protein
MALKSFFDKILDFKLVTSSAKTSLETQFKEINSKFISKDSKIWWIEQIKHLLCSDSLLKSKCFTNEVEEENGKKNF